jgi:hypothetical protein
MQTFWIRYMQTSFAIEVITEFVDIGFALKHPVRDRGTCRAAHRPYYGYGRQFYGRKCYQIFTAARFFLIRNP